MPIPPPALGKSWDLGEDLEEERGAQEGAESTSWKPEAEPRRGAGSLRRSWERSSDPDEELREGAGNLRRSWERRLGA